MAINISDEDFDEIFKGENTSKSRWQPIETAPENSEILVWDGKDIWLINTEYEMYPKQNGCGCCSSSVDDEATHWVPLPKPPKEIE